MTKYDELCAAYVAARGAFFKRRDACSDFVGVLMKGLEGYLEMPLFQFRFIPHSGEISLARTATAHTAAWLGTDQRWHYKVGFPLVEKVQPGTKGGSSQTLVADIHVVQAGDRFDVGVTGSSERFDLPPTPGAAEHQAFFGFLFQQMVAAYAQPGIKFLDNLADTQRLLSGER